MHVRQRVSRDGIGMHERRRQVCVVQQRLLQGRKFLQTIHLHVQQRVSSDWISMHERRPQVRVVQHRMVQGRKFLRTNKSVYLPSWHSSLEHGMFIPRSPQM